MTPYWSVCVCISVCIIRENIKPKKDKKEKNDWKMFSKGEREDVVTTLDDSSGCVCVSGDKSMHRYYYVNTENLEQWLLFHR